MENQKENNYIKIFGRIIFFAFLMSALCRIFFREDYSREDYSYVLNILLGLVVVHLILKLRYNLKHNRESTLINLKEGLINLKRYLPEMLIIGLMFALWFYYKRNGG